MGLLIKDHRSIAAVYVIGVCRKDHPSHLSDSTVTHSYVLLGRENRSKTIQLKKLTC